MNLNNKHLLPYFNYSLRIVREGFESQKLTLMGLQVDNDVVHEFGKTPIQYIKPILKPLTHAQSFLSEQWESDIDVRTFCNDEFIEEKGFENFEDVFNYKVDWMPVGLFDLLVKYHFDVFDLIQNDLAIDEFEFNLSLNGA